MNQPTMEDGFLLDHVRYYIKRGRIDEVVLFLVEVLAGVPRWCEEAAEARKLVDDFEKSRVDKIAAGPTGWLFGTKVKVIAVEPMGRRMKEPEIGIIGTVLLSSNAEGIEGQALIRFDGIDLGFIDDRPVDLPMFRFTLEAL
jgi:hypothetical protein